MNTANCDSEVHTERPEGTAHQIGQPQTPERLSFARRGALASGTRTQSLDRATILVALAALNERLAALDVHGELCLYGGRTMVLAFQARLSTHDVDAVFQPAEVIRTAAGEVGAELGLPLGWLNDGVKGWLSPAGELPTESLPQFSHLRITRPQEPYLLAMKCLAARAAGLETQGDRADIEYLMRALKLRSSEEVLRIVERFFPPERILPKTRFLIEEILSEMRFE